MIDYTFYHPEFRPRRVTTEAERVALLASDPLWRDRPYEEGDFGDQLTLAGDVTTPLTRLKTGGAVDVMAYVKWPTTATSGLIYAEAAYISTYTGRWSKQGEIPFELSDSCSAFKFGNGPFQAVRLRVVNAINGGPVSVFFDWSGK
jgi:hypothetical protein